MAANYWASTQRRHWQYTQESLSQIRETFEDEETELIQQYPLPDRRLLSQFFAQRPSPPLSRPRTSSDYLTQSSQN